MLVIQSSGEHRYRVVENFAKLPEGWEFKDAAAVACDSKYRIYVFNRGEHPMMVFDRDGNSCAPGAKACTRARTAPPSPTFSDQRIVIMADQPTQFLRLLSAH